MGQSTEKHAFLCLHGRSVRYGCYREVLKRIESMKIEPLGDKIVVKRLEAEDKTSGGILLPSAAQDKPSQGRVLSVGDGKQLPDGTRSPHQVQEGDRVFFGRYAGSEIIVDDEELLIMSEDEIIAILE